MTGKPGRPTLDQQRAAHAWKAAERAETELGTEAKRKFGAPAKKLGPRILIAGLGPAVQFLVAKKEAPTLVETLESWLLEEGSTKTAQRPRSLIDDIINGDSNRLRWLTAEALAYLAWLTRFCEARGLIEDET
jgi:CRISPR type III-B/RAMP module-associated protein Cmr5